MVSFGLISVENMRNQATTTTFWAAHSILLWMARGFNEEAVDRAKEKTWRRPELDIQGDRGCYLLASQHILSDQIRSDHIVQCQPASYLLTIHKQETTRVCLYSKTKATNPQRSQDLTSKKPSVSWQLDFASPVRGVVAI